MFTYKKSLNKENIKKNKKKIISNSGICSRREIIRINNSKNGINLKNNNLTLFGNSKKNILNKRIPRIILYNKPRGEVVSHKDPNKRKNIFSKLPNLKIGKWLFVGRLDVNTEGLNIFCNSGKFCNAINHPSCKIEREYFVKILGDKINRYERKILINKYKISKKIFQLKKIKCICEKKNNCWYSITVNKGRKREIKKTFELIGLTVARLVRIRLFDIYLPFYLKEGGWLEINSKLAYTIMIKLGLVLY